MSNTTVEEGILRGTLRIVGPDGPWTIYPAEVEALRKYFRAEEDDIYPPQIPYLDN